MMALGKMSILVGLLALLASPGAFALGLGEARVDSYLNQPLEIRIRLLDASELELDSLTVGPATPADYQRLGVGSSALALDLEFEIDRSVSPAVVRIRSSRVVSDPIVQLLVDARWSSGRLLREYTLFLDPPTLDIAPPPAPARSEPEPVAPESRPARPTARPITRTTPPASTATAPAARAVQSRAGGEHQVRSGDTLWSIAQANLPAGDITMNQMMIAIVELNPQAFRDGNIHQMLRGSELDLPDAAEARAVERARAAATVQAQNRAFNQRLAGDVPVISDAARSASTEERPTTPDPAPSRESTTAAREPEPEARLELVPAGEDEASSGLDEDGEEVNRLRQQLARTEEELFAARLEAEEFRSRLTDLENLVEDNPGGAGIADAELAGLEQTLRAARLAAAEDADPALREEVTAQLDEFLNRFESAAEMQAADGSETTASDSEGMDEPAVADEETVEPESAAEPVVTQVGEGNRSLWSSPLLLPLAGLALLLLLIAGAWFMLQRRRREADAPAVRGMPAETRREEPRVTPADDASTASDPIGRAADELAASPTDLRAHLTLLQALASEEHTDRFAAALEDMFEHVETGAEPPWREALELAGRIVPGHVLVKGSADWMSSDEGSGVAPMDELDEESEVGDLMSRLESESDDETDDRDWAEGADARKADDEALPSLHDDDDDSPATFEHLDAPDDDAVSSDPDAAVLNPTRDPEPDETKEAAPGAESFEDELDEDDRMVLDWTDSSDEAASSGPSEQDENESDIFAPSDDDVDVKLDLARAYLSWNSTDSAKTLLEEVVREGNDEQKEQAQKLLDDL
jgi:pilus assembly protein FimV